jgi:proteasome lid subunit RPN8/RPN11
MSDREAAPTNTTHLPPDAVRIPVPIWDAVLGHLCAGLPLEACGLLGGRRDGKTVRAVTWYPGTNVLASPTRFRMDDSEVIRAHVDMRKRHLELVGIVHSHPQSVPALSPTDLREAFYRDIALIVVSFSAPEPEAAAWTVPSADNAGPRQLELIIAR